MVSIIIIARGKAEELLDLMASILPQLTASDEILIVADPPPANVPSSMMWEVAHETARQIPCVHVLPNEHPGETAAYEQAIRACKGTYIFLAEPGDIWMPNKVSAMLDAFAASGSVLILHDIKILDAAHHVLAPSLFDLHENEPDFQESLLHNSYLGSSLAFLEPFREFFLPFPPEASHYDQWMGLIARRFGGIALITKPLIGKTLAIDGNLMPVPPNHREQRGEQRGLLRALKKREKELVSALRQAEQRNEKSGTNK
jgi:glycosyltransferase involved in cell wall biosynthesis